MKRTVVAGALVVLTAAAATLAFALGPRSDPEEPEGEPPSSNATSRDGPLRVGFDMPDGVIGTERSRGEGPLEVTSGSLLARDGRAWTGVPDRGEPDPEEGTTHSAVFRARTRRSDFADARIRLRIRNEGLTGGRRTNAYDGVSIGLRYRSPDELYYVNVQRRDGLVAIKKKTPSGSSGRYETLATGRREVAEDRWVEVEVTSRTRADEVAISLVIDGEAVLEAVDDGAEHRALTGPGRVLIRGDNCQFSFDDLAITPLT